jgi:hypothetical protein
LLKKSNGAAGREASDKEGCERAGGIGFAAALVTGIAVV